METRKLRDAVHKDIYLSALELRAIDTPQMQRLRGVRQLGAAYYVYPSAQHTRFEHCVGSCWMAKRIVSRMEAASGQSLPEPQRQAVFLAALVHDVTHIPFGHTFEDERRLLERHDRSQSRYELLVADCELGRALGASEPGRLALTILSPMACLPPEQRYLRQLVGGTVGADLLDYLRRDNYFCGLSYEFDDRVLDYFRLAGGELALDLAQDGYFRHDALSEVTNLLRIRYVLSERVYYHHAKMAAGVMISKAVERALAAGLTERDLAGLTDGALPFYLRQRFGSDGALVELLDDFEARRLFKRCYMVSRRIGERAVAELVQRYHMNESDCRGQAERRIAEALGIPPHRVAIYCAPADMALKEADVAVIIPDGQMTKLSALNHEEIQVLKLQHRELWRLYVFLSPRHGDLLSRAGQVCQEVIGCPNELPAERRGMLL